MPALPKYLVEEYNEIVISLYLHGYERSRIARIMNRDRSAVTRIINKMEERHKPKWIKVS